MADTEGPFELGEGPAQVTLAQGQQTTPNRPPSGSQGAPPPRQSAALRRRRRPLTEGAQFGMAPGKPGTGLHGGQDHLAKALTASHPVESRHGLPAAVDRPPIVALGLVSEAEVEVRERVQDTIPTGRSKREGALGGDDGLVIRAHEGEIA